MPEGVPDIHSGGEWLHWKLVKRPSAGAQDFHPAVWPVFCTTHIWRTSPGDFDAYVYKVGKYRFIGICSGPRICAYPAFWQHQEIGLDRGAVRALVQPAGMGYVYPCEQGYWTVMWWGGCPLFRRKYKSGLCTGIDQYGGDTERVDPSVQ